MSAFVLLEEVPTLQPVRPGAHDPRQAVISSCALIYSQTVESAGHHCAGCAVGTAAGALRGRHADIAVSHNVEICQRLPFIHPRPSL